MKRWMWLCVVLSLMLAACHNAPKKKQRGDEISLTAGTMWIAVDESFKPIMEEELEVYHAMYPEATINPIYCSEVDAINLFLKDSVRFVLANRQLTDKELESFHSRKFQPISVRVAVSGLALISNKENPDSTITVGQFKDILTGKSTNWKELDATSKLGDLQLVFDNPNSGIVHYAIDSLCGGAALAKSTVRAQKTNEEVIHYVSETPGAIGVIGANWIGESSDTTRLSFNKDIRVMSVSENESTRGYKPYQAYLALRQYPLTHDVYILVNDPRGALPTGLMTFLTGERGQRIILKSGLVPATQPVNIRQVGIKDEF